MAALSGPAVPGRSLPAPGSSSGPPAPLSPPGPLSLSPSLQNRTQPQTPQRTGMGVYKACARNDSYSLAQLIQLGVTQEAVREVDNNGWNCLMLACRKGFLQIVYVLHDCPYLDVNLQDNEGNTALMIASQAGYVSSVMYLLNYYPGVDTEIKDCRGFTALIKAAMKGRNDIVAILIMAGADMHAVDSTKGKCAQEWAQTTGRHETLQRIQRLLQRPRAEQCCLDYGPEGPGLQAAAPASDRGGENLARRIKHTLGCVSPQEPRDDGALDLMVRMTSGVRSPLVATACRPLCPSSPPQVGKRRLAVAELVLMHTEEVLRDGAVSHSDAPESPDASCSSSEVLPTVSCTRDGERRGSILSLASTRVSALLPRGLARRNSVAPAGSIPDISVSRSGEETPKKENLTVNQNGYLEPPTWKYNKRKKPKKKDDDKSKTP
ncbi:photoreceptor ankyrin repeat protein [Gadus morhua]|uniref:photoreceptor ankyrin repeat protein n=1 Tax=Gadus morhua TaxID=8049 RepID=UPI0011B403B6|nr:photoreceptor ankyrin repeat protein-like [Gadus morhua]XP_030231343.1 photoreceptor ankyrin repeat protein-like [Gadus morhua]